MTVHLRDGNRVIVRANGKIEYLVMGPGGHVDRTYRRDGLGSFEKSADWVRASAWGRDARFITYSA